MYRLRLYAGDSSGISYKGVMVAWIVIRGYFSARARQGNESASRLSLAKPQASRSMMLWGRASVDHSGISRRYKDDCGCLWVRSSKYIRPGTWLPSRWYSERRPTRSWASKVILGYLEVPTVSTLAFLSVQYHSENGAKEVHKRNSRNWPGAHNSATIPGCFPARILALKGSYIPPSPASSTLKGVQRFW